MLLTKVDNLEKYFTSIVWYVLSIPSVEYSQLESKVIRGWFLEPQEKLKKHKINKAKNLPFIFTQKKDYQKAILNCHSILVRTIVS